METISYSVRAGGSFKSFNEYKDALRYFKHREKSKNNCSLIKYWYTGGKYPDKYVVLRSYP